MVKKMSDRNTKSEILKAYEEQLNIVKNLKKDNALVVQEQHEEKNVEVNSNLTIDDIVKNLSDLKVLNHTTITELENNILEKKKQLDELNASVIHQHNKINNLYHIECEAESLTALLNSNSLEVENHKKIIEERKSKALEEIENLKHAHSESLLKHKKEMDELKANSEKEHSRRVEEFEYDMEKSKKRLDDQHQEHRHALELELEEKKRKNNLECDERLKEVSERETKYALQIEEIESFPKQIEDARNEASKKAVENLIAEHTLGINSLENKITNQKMIFENKINLLENTIESLKSQNESLRDEFNKANDKVQSIAVKAIEGAQQKVTTSYQPFVNSLETKKK